MGGFEFCGAKWVSGVVKGKGGGSDICVERV
jgi:hypothetical protein